MNVIWKRYKNTRYEVSNIGGVRNTLTGNIVLTAKRKQISITKNDGRRVRQSVAKMVATAFIPNPHNYGFTEPINGDRYDARVENIRWTKPRFPQDHNNRIKKPQTYKGMTFESVWALRRYKATERSQNE